MKEKHSLMKHGFFSVGQFLSHITKLPGVFHLAGVFHFPGIYLAGFFHIPRFFLSSRGFFHFPWFESLIFIQNSKIFKEMVRRFFHSPGFFHSPFKSVFFIKECHCSLQTEGTMTHSGKISYILLNFNNPNKAWFLKYPLIIQTRTTQIVKSIFLIEKSVLKGV